MATVGQQLSAPEAGWKRYDDTDGRIKYTGSWYTNTQSKHYNGAGKASGTAGDKTEIKFVGSKFRLIGLQQPYGTTSTSVYVDGIFHSNISSYGSEVFKVLSFEVILAQGQHTILFINNATGSSPYFVLDAIDIDDTGYLILPISINLTATAGDSQVTLSWDAVTGATGYNVKRSTTVGGPYSTIASNVSRTSYVDTDVINGTTYYYVVTAITADGESDNSNEASATPTVTETPGENGQALLRVTMIDSSEREYKLSMAEITGFVAWMDREVGTGTTVYVLNKMTGSKEYLAFDKIISFEVTEIK